MEAFEPPSVATVPLRTAITGISLLSLMVTEPW